MDLSGIEAIIPPVAQALGIEPATALLGLGVVVTVANVCSRVIPDDATGFLGGLRKVCSVIGVQVGNRITGNVTTNDVARAVVGTVVKKEVEDLAEHAEALIPEVIRDGVEKIVPAFPNHPSVEDLIDKFKDDDHVER